MKRYRFFTSCKFWIHLGCMLCLLFLLVGCGDITKNVQDQKDTCSACHLYKFFFEIIGDVSEKFFDKSREMSLDLLALGMLFYLASVAYKLGAGFMGQGDRDVLKLKDDLFKTIFKVMVVALLLSKKELFLSVIDFVVLPVLQAFIGVSQTVLDSLNVQHMASFSWDSNKTTTDFSAIFSEDIGQPIQNLIYNVWLTLMKGRELGWNAAVNLKDANNFVGAFVFGIFFFMSIFVPFSFIDAFFRLGFLLIVSPLVLICTPFQATKKTTKAAWDILFGSMIQILIACIFVSLMIVVFKTYTDGAFSASESELVDGLGELQLMKIGQGSSIVPTPLQVLLLIYCLSKMMKNIPVLAQYFGGDGTSGAVNQIGKALRSTVGSAVGAVAYPGGGVRDVMSKVGEGFQDMVNLTVGSDGPPGG